VTHSFAERPTTKVKGNDAGKQGLSLVIPELVGHILETDIIGKPVVDQSRVNPAQQ
jgi:hypothetical protein